MKGKLRFAVLLAALLCLPAPLARAAQCAPDKHSYAEVRRIPATATQDGEIDYVCTICGHEYTDLLFATDHLWGDWVTDQSATCTQPGRRHRTCTRALPHTESVAIPAIGHAYKETGTQPTCLKPGKRVFVCANDLGHTYEEAIPAFGSHNFGEWRTETAAGEGTPGQEARKCGRCGAVETRALAALPTTTAATIPKTEPPTEIPTQPPTEPPTEPPRSMPVMDIVLVSANAASWGFFAFLLIPYFLCLLYARRRRKAQEQRDALRKEVDELHGYK